MLGLYVGTSRTCGSLKSKCMYITEVGNTCERIVREKKGYHLLLIGIRGSHCWSPRQDGGVGPCNSSQALLPMGVGKLT